MAIEFQETQGLNFNTEPVTETRSDRIAEYDVNMLALAGVEQADPETLKQDMKNKTFAAQVRRQLVAQEREKVTKLKGNALQELYARGLNDPGAMEEFSATLQMKPNVPSTEVILQHLAANKLLQESQTGSITDDEETLDLYEQVPPEKMGEYSDSLDIAEEMLVKSFLVQETLQGKVSEYEDRSTGAKVGDHLLMMLPFYSGIQKRNNIPGAEGWLGGNNLKEQREILYSLPLDQFKPALEEALSKIDNPTLALEFLGHMLDLPETEVQGENFWDVFDAGSLVPVGALAKLSGNGMRMLKTVQNPMQSAQTTINAVRAINQGSVRDTAVIRDTIQQVLPSMFDTTSILGRQTKKDVGLINELQRIDRTIEESFGLVQTERLSPEAFARAEQRALDELASAPVNPNAKLMDIRIDHNPVSNTYRAVGVLGKQADNKIRMFSTPAAARNFAENYYKLGDYDIVGNPRDGFRIEVGRTFNETVRDVAQLQAIDSAKFPKQRGLYGRWIAGPELTLPEVQRIIRHQTTFSSTALLGQMKGIFRNLTRLNRRQQEDLSRILSAGAKDGKWYTLDELEATYHRLTGRLPTDKEKLAYYTERKLADYTFAIRNFDIFKNKTRLGMKDVHIRTKDGDGYFMEAIPADEIKTIENEFILFDNDLFKGGVSTPSRPINKVTLDSILSKDGVRIFKVAHPTQMMEAHGKPFTYVVSRKADVRELPLTQLAYRDGYVPRLYEDGFFIKQPKFFRDGNTPYYYGDRTFFSAQSTEEAEKIVKGMNRVLDAWKRYQKGNLTRADMIRFVEENTPWTMTRFEDLVNKKIINPDEPFSVVESGSNTLRKRNLSGFVALDDNYTDIMEYYRTSGRMYTGRRGDQLTRVTYNQGAIRQIDEMESEVIDPVEAAVKSVSNAVSIRGGSDYRLASMQQWVETFRPYLNLNKDVIDPRDVYTVFKDAQIDKNLVKENPEIILQANNMRDAINRFINTPTPFQEFLELKKNQLAREMGEKFGWSPDTVRRMQTRLDPLAAPITFMRSMAFNMYLGLFNIRQLFLQAQTSVLAMAVDPKNGAQAAALVPFIRAGLLNKGTRPLSDKWASQIRLTNKGEFEEYLDIVDRLGIHHIEGEVSYIDDINPQGYFRQGGVGRFVEHGRKPFNEGERINRYVASWIAYKRWKEANPKAKVDNKVLNKLAAETSNLSFNMTRASAARWQKGPLSLPTQFLSFHARVMEKMIGKDLTRAEKARIFAASLATYGLIGGVPLGNYVRNQMVENGINVEDNGAIELIAEGFVDQLIEGVTGADVNVGESFGPAMVPLMPDLISGDLTAIELLTGPAGTAITNVMGNFRNLPTVLSLPWKEGVQLTLDEVYEAARTISSLNNAHKAVFAMKHGQLLSKTTGNVLVDGVTPTESLLMILGLTPDEVGDAYTSRDYNRSRNESIRAVAKDFNRYYTKGLTLYAEGNQEEGLKNLNIANALREGLDMNPIEYQQFRRELSDSPLSETREEAARRITQGDPRWSRLILGNEEQ